MRLPPGMSMLQPTWTHGVIGLCALSFCLLPQASAQTADAPVRPAAAPTIHTTARLFVVEVVVTDGNGTPVKGLKQSDFHLIERKSPQTIGSFEEHTGVSQAAAPVPPPKLEPGVFTNAGIAPASPAVNVLLLDLLNTPVQDQTFVRGQLLQYLRNSKPGSRIAIFGLTSRLVMLQGFTTDPEMLRRAVERSNPQASPLLAEKVGGKTDVVADQITGIEIQLAAEVPQMGPALAEFDATEKNVDQNLRAEGTLHALNQLARYLAGIPGRKNLMWFSASFPLSILPRGSADSNPFAGSTSWEAEYRETVNLLAWSRVAVYPIDARGLMPSPMLQASNSGTSAPGLAKAGRAFSGDVFESQSTMLEMAEDTGGKAFVNTNGLA